MMKEETVSIPKENSSKNEGRATFEEAIEATKFGRYNFLLLLVAIPAGWSTKFDTTTLSFILPAAQCDLDLSLNDKGMLNGIGYAGMISSGFLWGFLFDTLGRKRLLVIGYFFGGIFTILIGISQNYPLLLFAKFMSGFCIAGPHAAYMTYISEFHCAKYRTRVLMMLGMTFNVGNMALPLLAWAILPQDIEIPFINYNLHSWNVYVMLCSLPCLISSFAFSRLPESPKFLMTQGRNEEALHVFKKVYVKNTGQTEDTYPIKLLIEEIKSQDLEANQTETRKFKEAWKQTLTIFFPPHLSKLILICSFQFLLLSGLNTLRLWMPQIFAAIDDYEAMHGVVGDNDLCDMLTMMNPAQIMANGTAICSLSYINDSLYVKNIIISVGTIMSFVLVGMVINKFGKKPVILILTFLSGCSAIGLYFARDAVLVTLLSGAYISLGGVSPNIIVSITVDLLPTSLRTTGVSLSMVSGRAGSLIGNITFPSLLTLGCVYPFIIIGGFSLICFVCVIFIPNTDQKSLE